MPAASRSASALAAHFDLRDGFDVIVHLLNRTLERALASINSLGRADRAHHRMNP